MLQRFPRALLLHLAGAGEQGFEIAELLQQLHRALLADALDAGHVVRRIADQCEPIRHLRRWHTEPVRGVGLGDPDLIHACGPSASRIQQRDARPDQLIEILVTRDDHRLQLLPRSMHRECPDHVIGLVTVHFHQRYPEGGK